MQLAHVRDNVLIFFLFLFFCWLLPHLPSAWSVDPTSRLTGVVQKKQSPQGVPLRPGTKKGGRKKKTKKPKVLTPKYMGHVQASSHKWWNSTLPTFLTVSFFWVRSVPFMWLHLLSLCQHYLFPSDWEGNMTDRLQTQGKLLPIAIFGARVSWETGASSQYTGVVMESRYLREKVLTHCILRVKDKYLHDLQHLEVSLQSCGPRTACMPTALADAWKDLCLLLQSQGIEEDLAKKSSLLLVSQCSEVS